MDRRFRPDELTGSDVPGGGPSSPELAEALGAARELEWLAGTESVGPSDGFADRVMSAIASEPLPAPIAAVGAAARAGRIRVLAAAFGDVWRVAWGGGRPFAMRAQALAIVLVVLVAAGSLTGLAAVGALNVLSPERTPELTPAVSPGPAIEPSEAPTPSPSPSPEPSESAAPSDSAEPSDSAVPSETPGSTGAAPATPRPTPKPTPRPTDTPKPTDTPEPSDTPSPTGTDDHGGDRTPEPSSTSGG